MGFLFPVMYLRCWCRRYVILQKQLCIYLNSKGEVVPKDGESWNCNTLDTPAGINPYTRASVRFDICLCEGHPAHWQGLSWSSSSYLTPAWRPGSLCRMFQRLFHCGLVRTRVDPWHGRAVVSRGWPRFLSCGSASSMTEPCCDFQWHFEIQALWCVSVPENRAILCKLMSKSYAAGFSKP